MMPGALMVIIGVLIAVARNGKVAHHDCSIHVHQILVLGAVIEPPFYSATDHYYNTTLCLHHYLHMHTQDFLPIGLLSIRSAYGTYSAYREVELARLAGSVPLK